MSVEVTTLLLCAIGLYASAFMWRKAHRAALGLLREPSVVQTPRARAIGRIPNAAFGMCYYAALAVATLLPAAPVVWWPALGASLLAALFSAYLAYSLLFVTRMPCPYCWTTHAINWALPLLLLARHR
jgi:uncharacterized membrane protein